MSDQPQDPSSPPSGDPQGPAAGEPTRANPRRWEDTAPIAGLPGQDPSVPPAPSAGQQQPPAAWGPAQSGAALPVEQPRTSSGHATVPAGPGHHARPTAPFPAAPPTAQFPVPPAAALRPPPGLPGPQGSYQGFPGAPAVGGAPYPPHAGHPSQGLPPVSPPLDRARRRRSSTPGWLVPTTCLLALLLGTAGGFLGSALQHRGDDSRKKSTVRTTTQRPTTSTTYAPQEPPLAPSNGSVTAVADVMLPSTVQILAFNDADDEEPTSTGSGFVLDEEGRVVTNNHVVADTVDGGAVKVVDSAGDVLEAEVVGRSPVYDVAVLQVTDDVDLPPAVLGSEGELKVGDQVVAIGAPLGLTQTVTSGIVSALRRPVSTGSAADDTSYISAVQTDAAINPGNSGGPLLNMSGQVVGVNSAIATTGTSGESGNIGVGFAIPIAQVRRTVDQILATGEAEFPIIGATVLPVQVSFTGAEITAVEDGGPADRAGLETGDVITAVGDERVTDGVGMIVAIRTHQPGETVTLTRERDGQKGTVEVTLDARSG